jgi:gamma-glutamylcysteine synthetase
VLAIMRQQQLPFFRFTMNQSIAHKGYFEEHPLRGAEYQRMRDEAAESLVRQQHLEAEDTVDFDEFLKAYLALA